MSVAVATYPTEREGHVALRDGSVAHVRPIRADDEPGLLAFLRALSDDDRRRRFFSMGNDLTRAAHEQVDVDYIRSLGLLATIGSDEHIVGHALYAPCGEGHAEVAFAISSDYQGRGLATLLLGQLAEVAAAHGIDTFEAVVLPENRRMLRVFRESGFPLQTRFAGDTIEVTFPTSLAPEALARFEQREELASACALRRVLYPSSVAVIGVSRTAGSVGHAVLHNLIAAGYPGPIYSVPTGVDLAIIAVPADQVVATAEQCGRRGVHALVVLSAGFSEVGAEGERRQTELLRVCRASGMRLIGPNCNGVINTDPAAPLNATFGSRTASAGRVGFATQSGALGLAALESSVARRLGLSNLVSMGNKADISGNDLLGYWHTDPRTDVILLCLESFGNARKFGRLARTIARSKPIVALKSGHSAVTVDALFRQAGVIRTDTLDEMLDVADLLANQPLPRGGRVAIVTNVDEPQARGLQVLIDGTAENYALAIRTAADDPSVDAVIAIFQPTLATREEDVAHAIVSASDGVKPVLAVFMTAGDLPDLSTAAGGRVPGYHTPESAAIALAHVAQYAEWRAQPVETPPVFADVQRDEAGLLLADALGHGAGWLSPAEARRLLSLYGIQLNGVELQVGVINDPRFGPTVTCGESIRLTPLTRADASSMVCELCSVPKCDVDKLEDVLLRLGALAEDHPQIAEIDCNARVRVEAVAPPRPLGARR
jgi:succinyl-CoA synthetase alpha subunit/RimJ/RimL family protein N-acetyltransferase